MRVAADGGACECPTCGARCEGRFAACEPILEKPGYVPPNAPDWAVRGLEPPHVERRCRSIRSAAQPRTADEAEVLAPEDVIAMVREELEATTTELRALVVQAVEEVKTAQRDDAALSVWVEDAVEHAQSRLGDALTARVLQALRPATQQNRTEMLDAIDAVRRELSDRTEQLSSAQDRLQYLYREFAAGSYDE